MGAKDLSKKIEQDLALAVKKNKAVKDLYDKAVKGSMTYDEAGRFASILGEEIGGQIVSHLTGDVTGELIEALIPSALRNEHSYVVQAVKAAQETVNKKAKVGLKAVIPAFDEEKAVSLARTVAQAEDVVAAAQTLPAMTENFSRTIVDTAIRLNAEAHDRLGMETTVIREYSDVGLHGGKDDCSWCLERAGTWSYRDAVANDVFRRHQGCKCKIAYITKRSVQVQTNWTQNMWQEVGRRR